MEYLFNHLDICSLIYCGNTTQALDLFIKRYEEHISKTCLSHCKIYLTSLNLSIYNYILIKENISLHKCCSNNMYHINNCYTSGSIRELGCTTITSYCFCSEYLIEKHKNPHIKKAISYIHDHLSEPLTLESVCDFISINKCYFSTLFKNCTGYRFNDYVNYRRVHMAKKLLKESNLPLDVISMQCGFNSYSYFSTIFKKTTGYSPSSIRIAK